MLELEDEDDDDEEEDPLVSELLLVKELSDDVLTVCDDVAGLDEEDEGD